MTGLRGRGMTIKDIIGGLLCWAVFWSVPVTIMLGVKFIYEWATR